MSDAEIAPTYHDLEVRIRKLEAEVERLKEDARQSAYLHLERLQAAESQRDRLLEAIKGEHHDMVGNSLLQQTVTAIEKEISGEQN